MRVIRVQWKAITRNYFFGGRGGGVFSRHFILYFSPLIPLISPPQSGPSNPVRAGFGERC